VSVCVWVEGLGFDTDRIQCGFFRTHSLASFVDCEWHIKQNSDSHPTLSFVFFLPAVILTIILSNGVKAEITSDGYRHLQCVCLP
jgi:hypothetical protein